MTIQWGAWNADGTHRVGIQLSMTSSTNIQAEYYFNTLNSATGIGLSLSASGAYTGTDYVILNCAAGDTVLVATHDVTGTPGGAYTFGATAWDASVSGVSITIPPVPPSTPGIPSLSSITSSSVHVTWTPPSNWGGDDWRDADGGRYDVQVATNPYFMDAITHNGGVEEDDFTGLTSEVTYYVHVRAKNDAGYSSWSGYRSFTTLPAPPAAPTGLAVASTSDTSQTLTWTHPSGATSQPVQRAVVDANGITGPYATIATVSGTAEIYADNATAPNRVYRYRVQAQNSGGTSTSAETGWVHTTPAAPSGVTVTVTPIGDIRLDWTVEATDYDARTQVEHTTDGTTWTALTTTTAAATATYTHTAPSPTTHTYRLKAAVTGGISSDVGHGLASGWTVSATIMAPAPPNAPTGMKPNGGTVDLTRDQGLAWTHSPSDGSPQSGFEVQHRPVGGSTWTSTGHLTGSGGWTLPAGTYTNAQGVEWQVRTWGQLTDAGSVSPWSATATISGSTTPTVTITAPGSTVGTSSVTMSWAYYQAEGSPQVTWRAYLIDAAGTTVTLLSGTGATSSVTFDGLVNAATYQMRVVAQSAAGLWSDADVINPTVDFLPPAPIDVAANFDEQSGAVVLTLTPQTADGVTTVDQVAAYIERSTDSGLNWQRLNVVAYDPRSSVLDTTAPVDGSPLYRVVAMSATPSTGVGDPVQVDRGTDYGYLSCGDDYTTVVRFWANLAMREDAAIEQVAQRFEGRALPVVMSGTALAHGLSVSGHLTSDSSTPDDMRRIAQQPGPHLWRDPSGRVLFGMLSGMSITPRTPTKDMHAVSFSIDEADH